jgi:hypothetical protein
VDDLPGMQKPVPKPKPAKPSFDVDALIKKLDQKMAALEEEENTVKTKETEIKEVEAEIKKPKTIKKEQTKETPVVKKDIPEPQPTVITDDQFFDDFFDDD